MAVIGVAEVPVRPSFRGFQQTVGKEMSGVGQTMEKNQGRSMGQRLMSGIGTGLKVGAAVVGTATAGILTTALVKGWQRLTAIENAEAKLKGLGHSAGDVTKIMDNALASVKGTAFGMDEAATTAASAVAAGITPGKDLEDVLRLTADAATIAGTDMASMGSIFNKVAGSNKIQGDSIAQLHDAGIPVIQMLAKEMGTSVEETYKLASAGKINFATFRAAMEDGVGGAAMSAGDTTTGAFSNMMAALSRFGAQLLVGVFPLAKHVFGGITTLIDNLTMVAEPVVQSLSQGMVDGLKTLGDAWNGTSSDVQQSGFMGFLQRFGTTARGVFDSVVGWISRFRDSWKESADTVEGTGIAGFFDRFSTAAGGASGAASVAGGILESLGAILSSVAEVLPGLVQSGLSAFASALEWISDNMHIILPLIGVAVAGFAAWRVAMMGVQASMFSLQAAQLAMTPVITMNNLLRLAAIRGERQHAIATGSATVADYKRAAAMTAKTRATGMATAAQRGLNGAMRANPIGAIITAVTLLVGALVWFFTQTETGQAIVTRVWEGIKNVVAGVVSWFQGTLLPVMQSVWTGITTAATSAWNGIKDVVGGVVSWFQTTVVGSFKQIYSSIFKGDFIGGGSIAEDSPVITFIFKLRNAAASVAGWFTGTFVPAMKSAWNGITSAATWAWNTILNPVFTAIGKIATWLWTSVIKPYFNFIGAAFRTVGSVLSGVWTGLLRPTIQLFGDIMVWLYEKQVQPRLLWMQAAWRVMVNAVVGFWTGRIRPMIQAFGNLVRALYTNYIQPALGMISDRWSWISAKVTGFWRNSLRPILSAFGTFVKVDLVGAIRTGLSWVNERWTWITDKVSGIWNNRLRPIFRAVGEFVKTNLVGAIRTGLSWVNERWTWITDKVSGIWNNRLKPIFKAIGDFVKNDVVDMVKDGVSAIDRAWRKVANFFRKPINWVINTVWNDGIKGAFDNVAKAVDSDARLGRIPTIPAFAKGGRHDGGWALVGEEGPELVNFTNPGRVYTATQTQKALGGDVTPANADLFAGTNPAEAMLPMGGWVSKAWDAVKGAASGVVSWVRGGLANAAEMLLKPILSGVSGFVSKNGKMGELGGGMIDWGVDEILNWIRGEDKVAEGGGFEYDGPMNMGNVYRPARGAITSPYGKRWGRLHGGVDFAGPRGAPTFAAYDGVVHSIQNYAGGSGLSVNLSHGGGKYTHYGHNDYGGIPVKAGQSVRAGQRIGNIGMTGNTTGPHLHFEQWQGGLWNRTNPNNLFRDEGGLIYPGLNAVLNQDRRPEYTFNERDFHSVRDIIRGGAGGRGQQLEGNLYLDSGEFLGKVRGEVSNELNKSARAAVRGARGKAGVS